MAGRYRLLDRLGQGGMGIVWLAHDELLDRPVAVKEVLYRALSEQDRAAFNRRTIREARTAGRLDHPSVVVVHDVVEEDGRPWIVMQLVRSRSLGEVIRTDGPLSPARAAAVGTRVLSALRAAHAAGVLHRDVKPENVLLAGEDRVVLTDFGIATLPEETALTATGELSGTPAFLPPERLAGRPATPASDLWSLGATLYAAVEGRPPFDRGAPVPTMAAVLNDPPDPVRLAGPLAPVIDGLLRKEPERRMTAAEAAAALERIAGGTVPAPAPAGPMRPGPVRPETVRPGPGGRPRGRRAAVAAAGALLLAGLGAAGWYALRPSTSPVTGSGRTTPATALNTSAAPRTVTPAGTATGSAAAVDPATTPSTGGTASARPSPGEFSKAHLDRLGFVARLPGDWVEFGREEARVRFRRPGDPGYLLVDTTRWDARDAWTATGIVERRSLAEKRLPGYRRITRLYFRFQGRPAVRWEFTWRPESGPVHVVDLLFTTRSGRHFALYWQVPEREWKRDPDRFDRFAATFRAS
ncbi:serine/threonine-protein kinase [Sphaerisporangium rufum]|uniref:serine/threonine-protein kinase n=1 Tax=Sphaerisporangium rufum TaxID=1381558 RepID=UPI00194F2B2F|nr:serine/threonine-protein kinase [Sphaerisporangium rufum]